MSKKTETKHDRFMRLMQRRLDRTYEELRLVSQLSSPNYENSAEEAEEVVRHLTGGVQMVAKSFEVPFSFLVGVKAQTKTVGPRTEGLGVLEIAKVIDHIHHDRKAEALALLRTGMGGGTGVVK